MLVSSPLRSLALALALLGGVVLSAGPALAHSYKLGSLDIHHPWARPTTGNTGAAYFEIANAGKSDDTLIAIESDVARSVELHTTIMDGTVMRMRKLDRLPLPAGKTVKAAPGGLHIMLVGLKAPLKDGDQFPMRLVFEKAGRIEVSVHVQTPEEMRRGEMKGTPSPTDRPGMGDMHDDHDMHDMH